MLAQLAPHVFLGPAQRRLLRRGTPVFTFHCLGTPPPGARDPFLWTAPETFERQLAMLRAAGWERVPLSEVPAAEKKCAFTFDDGEASALRALEPLARHGFHATLFVVAGLVGGHNDWDARHGHPALPLLDWPALREWIAAGHEIGSHSLTHRNHAHLDAAELREQTTASRKLLEDRLGVPVRHYCYPHGSWTPAARDAVADAGYETACTTTFGVNDSATDRLLLRRIVPLSSAALCAKAWHRLRRRAGLLPR